MECGSIDTSWPWEKGWVAPIGGDAGSDSISAPRDVYMEPRANGMGFGGFAVEGLGTGVDGELLSGCGIAGSESVGEWFRSGTEIVCGTLEMGSGKKTVCACGYDVPGGRWAAAAATTGSRISGSAFRTGGSRGI